MTGIVEYYMVTSFNHGLDFDEVHAYKTSPICENISSEVRQTYY